MIDISIVRLHGKTFYSHKLTDKGHLLLHMINERIKKKDLLQNTKRLINKLNEFFSDALEMMASLYYLHLESPTLHKSKLMQELKSRKPHLSNPEINKSFVIFDIMNAKAVAE